MAKFCGEIGFGESVETAPGVWQDVIVEHMYYGDVLRNTLRRSEGDQVNNNLSVGNSISVVADPYANEHFFAMRYIRWMGVLWTITEIEVQSPRLLIRIGEVYNGPTS